MTRRFVFTLSLLALKPLYISVCSICLISGRYWLYIFFISLDQKYVWVKILCLISYGFVFLYLSFTSLYLALPSPWTCHSKTFDHLHMFYVHACLFVAGRWHAHKQERDSAITASLLFLVAGCKWPEQLVQSTQGPCLGLIHSRRDGCRVHLFVMYSRCVRVTSLAWPVRCGQGFVIVDPTQLLFFGIPVR